MTDMSARNLSGVNPEAVRSMDDLKNLRKQLGLSPDTVDYLDAPNARKDGGETLVSQTDDGQWMIAGYERGDVFLPEYFQTNLDALRHLAHEAVRVANQPKADLSPEELAELDATADERRRKIEEDFDRWQKAEIERRARAAHTDDPQ